MAVALSELQRRFFDRMDEGQSQYVTPQQATDLINEAYAQLWGIYVDRAPVYMETDYQFSSVTGQRDYPLPTDFRRAVALYRVTNGYYYEMKGFEKTHYNKWPGFDQYQLLGSNIRVSLPSGSTTTYELWYIPHYIPLVTPLDVMDSRIYPGHEQWIINQAVILVKTGKEEQPCDDLIAQNDRVRAQIENDLMMRDQSESSRVVMYPRWNLYEDPWQVNQAASFIAQNTTINTQQPSQPASTQTSTSTATSTGTSSGSSSSSSGSSSSTGSTSSGSGSTSTGTSTSTPSSTPTSTPTSTATQTPTANRQYSYVYQNGTQNGWQNNNNYGGVYQIANDTRTAGGVAIEGAVNQYGGFNFGSLNNTNLTVNNYLGIQFDAYSASGAPVIRVQVDPGNNQSPIVSEYFTLSTGWNTYTMLYNDAAAVNSSSVTSTFTNVEFVNMAATTTPNIFLNNIALIVNPSPPQATYSLVATDQSPAATTTGWLHVKGNQFYDASGNVWMGRGVNCPDTRLDGKSYTNNQVSVVPELTRRIQWAINQGCDWFRLLLDMRNSTDDIANNADYLNAIKQVVNYIGTKGAHVMISCWNDWTCQPFGNGQSGQPTVASLTHWSQIATSFRNCGHVVYGLCNEPRSNDTPSLLSTYTNITNQCISVIRQVEARDGAQPHLIIVQGSSSYSRNIPYFLSNPATDPYFPITSSTSVGYIGYEVHCYEAPSYWNAEFEAASAQIPLIVGEFGPNDPNGTMVLNTTEDDVTPLMTYCSQHNIPYTAWTFDYNSPPDMLVNNSSDGSYGVNQTLQWTQPWGITFINNLRAQKGLTGTVDVYGNVSGSGATGGTGGSGSGSGGSGGTGGTGGGSGTSGTYTQTFIYQNGLQSSGGWSDGSYTGTYGTGSDTRVTGGVSKTAAIQQYGAVNFNHSSLSVSSYKGIQFDAYAASGAPALRVQVDANNVTSPIIYEMETIGSTGWVTYTVLWTDSGAVGTATGSFSNVELVNLSASTTPTIYLNNICLLS